VRAIYTLGRHLVRLLWSPKAGKPDAKTYTISNGMVKVSSRTDEVPFGDQERPVRPIYTLQKVMISNAYQNPTSL
jgi:hypothetical protein